VRFSIRRSRRGYLDCKNYKHSITPYAETQQEVYYVDCEKKNANNDCPDFFEKVSFWKFWKKPKANNLENTMKIIAGIKVKK
jgi:hypothetical protein